jgi:hypothetical protein
MPLIDVDYLKDAIPIPAAPELDADKDTMLGNCIDAALELMEWHTGRTILSAAQTVSLNGDDAGGRFGEVLRLPKGHRPVTVVTSITENGVALTSAAGYSTTVDVIIDGLDKDAPCRLVRRTIPGLQVRGDTTVNRWRAGVQNIAVVYTAGFTDAGPDVVPESLKLLNAKLAWLIWKGPIHAGQVSKSKATRGMSYLNQLSEMDQWQLNQWAVR